MNKVLKVIKQNTLVRTTREEHYIDKKVLYDVLRKNNIFYRVDWNTSHHYKYNTYPRDEENGTLDFNRSITISQEKVNKLVCDEVGIRGYLIIDSIIETDDDGAKSKEIRSVYILVEKREVLENEKVELKGE